MDTAFLFTQLTRSQSILLQLIYICCPTILIPQIMDQHFVSLNQIGTVSIQGNYHYRYQYMEYIGIHVYISSFLPHKTQVSILCYACCHPHLLPATLVTSCSQRLCVTNSLQCHAPHSVWPLSSSSQKKNGQCTQTPLPYTSVAI